MRLVAINGDTFISAVKYLVCYILVINFAIILLAASAATAAIFIIIICIGNASIFLVRLKLVKGTCFILPVTKLELPPLVIKDFNHFQAEGNSA